MIILNLNTFPKFLRENVKNKNIINKALTLYNEFTEKEGNRYRYFHEFARKFLFFIGGRNEDEIFDLVNDWIDSVNRVFSYNRIESQKALDKGTIFARWNP